MKKEILKMELIMWAPLCLLILLFLPMAGPIVAAFLIWFLGENTQSRYNSGLQSIFETRGAFVILLPFMFIVFGLLLPVLFNLDFWVLMTLGLLALHYSGAYQNHLYRYSNKRFWLELKYGNKFEPDAGEGLRDSILWIRCGVLTIYAFVCFFYWAAMFGNNSGFLNGDLIQFPSFRSWDGWYGQFISLII